MQNYIIYFYSPKKMPANYTLIGKITHAQHGFSAIFLVVIGNLLNFVPKHI